MYMYALVQELVSSYQLEEVQRVLMEDDPCSVVMVLQEGGSVRFHVDTSRMAWDIKNIVQRGKDGGDVQVHIMYCLCQ